MTAIGNYTLIQYPNDNRIVIGLPQRLDTIQTTVQGLSDRRYRLTDTEEVALLVAVKAMFENGRDEVEDTFCTEENCEVFNRDLNCDRCKR